MKYYASHMIVNIHSDASYLSETKVRSRACRHFFMGWMPKNGELIKINGAFLREPNNIEIRGGVSGRG